MIKKYFENNIVLNGKQMPNMKSRCYAWSGRIVKDRAIYSGKNAARVAWLLYNGSIPDGLHVLHECDNPECTKLEHLFLGTHKDNMQDMMKKKRHNNQNKSKTHCKKGHEFTKDNLYINKSSGNRQCKICMRYFRLKSYYKKKELNAAR